MAFFDVEAFPTSHAWAYFQECLPAQKFENRKVSWADIFTTYPDLKSKILYKDFFALCTLLGPRTFSISSSSALNPNTLELTVGLAASMVEGKLKKGLLTGFYQDYHSIVGSKNIKELGLDRILSKQQVQIMKQRPFSMPVSSTVPIICIGVGTGVAPFRSFWQERCKAKLKGQLMLYLGYRTKD